VERDVDLTAMQLPAGEFPGESKTKVIETQKTFTNFKKATCGTGDRIDLAVPQVSCDVYDMEASGGAKRPNLRTRQIPK
jgi:hypothetical protein